MLSCTYTYAAKKKNGKTPCNSKKTGHSGLGQKMRKNLKTALPTPWGTQNSYIILPSSVFEEVFHSKDGV